MQSQLYSVSKIFSERLFRIPDYQRGYAWTDRQLKDFWNDLVQLEVDKNHYCGVITLEKVNKKAYKPWQEDLWIIESRSFEPFFVVDGQQRLTTTIILLQAIIEIFDENDRLNYLPISEIRQKFIYESKDNGVSRSYIFGYEKDNPSYEFLKTEIFLENSVKSYIVEETIYTHNLLRTKNYFLDKLKQYEKSDIEVLFKKLTQHFLFNIYSISNDIDVFVAFETMNNRGKALSHLELLKNRLIYLTTKMDLDVNDKAYIRNVINDTWKAVYHSLGKNKTKPLEDDVFLKTHFFIYVYPAHKENLNLNDFRYYHSLGGHQEPYTEFLFDEKFSQKRIDVEKDLLTAAEILKYVESLQKSVIVWYYLNFPVESKSYSKEEKELLERINRIDFEDASPILLVLFSKKTRKDIRFQLLTSIEKILFIDSLTYRGESEVARDFLIDAIHLISGDSKIEDYLKRLDDSIKNYTSSDKLFYDVRRRIINTNYYEWRGIKYFLYEYEKMLQVQSKNKTPKIQWEEFDVNLHKDDFVSVEHIYPQKAVDESWKQKFADYSLKERRILCNSLGNLLALSKPKNSSLQNKPFAAKKENNANSIGYRFGSYSEIEVSLNADWTPGHILERGILLLKFMEKHWKLKLGNRSQKIELLKLEFLKK